MPSTLTDGPLQRAFELPHAPLDVVLGPLAAVERAMRHVAAAALRPNRRRSRRAMKGHEVARDRFLRSPPDGGIVYLPALPWEYRFQRPQQLALALVSRGQAVLYVEAFDRGWIQPARKLTAIGPGLDRLALALPGRPDPFRDAFPPERAARLARQIAVGLSVPPTLILVQLPFWLPLARELHTALGCPWVYDRIDLHRGFAGVPESIAAAERELLATVDLVTATSGDLADSSRDLARQVLTLPNGVALEDFRFREETRSRQDGLRLGYVGALDHWFDADAIRAAAEAEPDWSFLLAGSVDDAEVARLAELGNVTLVGEIPYREVGDFLGSVDVALVPFRDLPLTRAVDPVKLYEAFAVGLPVVGRDLPELRRWREPWLFLYGAPEELRIQVRRARDSDAAAHRRARRRAVSEDTWTRRAATLLSAARLAAGERCEV